MKLFLHMPKTAGTTLVYVLQKVYGTDRVYHEPDVYTDSCALANDFLLLPAAERSRIEVLCGHFPVGFHALMPEAAPYITMLREPVERLISFYYYMREHPADERFKDARKYNSIAAYIRSGVTRDVDNGMTRVIAGYPPGQDPPTPFGGCTRDLLEQAKYNLRERFCFVGLTEQFPQSLVLMKRAFEWKRVPMFESLNATQSRPAKEDVSQEDMAALLEHTQLDRELYAYAKARLDDLAAAQGDAFAVEVATLTGDLQDYQQLYACHAKLERTVKEITSTRIWRWSRPVARMLQPAMRLARRVRPPNSPLHIPT
jgi:hypothetical protein